jgi:protein gp37
MSGRTSIEWTDRSSNPLRFYHAETGKRGWFCVPVSAGCAGCYAGRRNVWIGNGLRFAAQNAHLVRVELDVEELRSWGRLKPGTKVFAFDMTDLFLDLVSDALLDQIFAAMGASHATFQVLTKRPERMRAYVADWYRRTQSPLLKNVWLGVSAEDQPWADVRIPLLLQTPAAVRFVSYEPALGPVEFAGRGWLGCFHAGYEGRDHETDHSQCAPTINQIIVGGESGPGARPFLVKWARDVRRQCLHTRCAFFMKQMGSLPLVTAGRLTHWDFRESFGGAAGFAEYEPDASLWRWLLKKKGAKPEEWPKDLRVREFPKVAA